MNPNQALWEKGDFTRIAAGMRESGEALVATFGIRPGMRVLDLGCGDGTTALPAARQGADVLGVDIARNLVDAGNRRAAQAGLAQLPIPGRRCLRPEGPRRRIVRPRRLHLRGHVRAEALRRGKAMMRVTRRGGRIVMGNWIPNDPTLVAQILKISSAYTPPPPEGFVSPMTWGVEDTVTERFVEAGVPAAQISYARRTFTFSVPDAPAAYLAAFRTYYGPTMNAFEAAEKSGRAADLQRELEDLFNSQNTSRRADRTSIPATFLQVTVTT